MDSNNRKSKNLAQWLNFLENLHPTEIELGLDRVLTVAQHLLPEIFHANGKQSPPFKVITIGGTNGKGSSIAFLQSILIESGYKTASYTSPHFINFNERIQINAQNIEDADLCSAFEQIESVRAGVSLSYFEYTTLAAFYYFVKSKCDVVLLEVGLGGRLDAVNILDAHCSLVTTVDIDHQSWLGNSKEEIAYEKAGIYRKNQLSIYGDNNTPNSLLQYSQQIGSHLLQFGVDYNYVASEQSWFINLLNNPDSTLEQYHISYLQALNFPQLAGAIQLKNATNAIICLLFLKPQLTKISGLSINRGIKKAYLRGRYQYISRHPDVLLDVAHNQQAARQLKQFLLTEPTKHNHAIFSILADKDIDALSIELADSFASWHIVPIDSIRGMTTDEIKNNLQSHVKTQAITCYNSFSSAYTSLMEQVKLMDQNLLENRIVTFGSFLTVAQAMEFFHGN